MSSDKVEIDEDEVYRILCNDIPVVAMIGEEHTEIISKPIDLLTALDCDNEMSVMYYLDAGISVYKKAYFDQTISRNDDDGSIVVKVTELGKRMYKRRMSGENA